MDITQTFENLDELLPTPVLPARGSAHGRSLPVSDTRSFLSINVPFLKSTYYLLLLDVVVSVHLCNDGFTSGFSLHLFEEASLLASKPVSSHLPEHGRKKKKNLRYFKWLCAARPQSHKATMNG